MLAGSLSNAGEYSRALDLAESMVDKDDTGLAESLALGLAVATANRKNRDRLQAFLEGRVLVHQNRRDKISLGVAHYNLGNFLRAEKPALAFRHYRKAIEHAPAYSEKPYFFRELGGLLFEAHRFSLRLLKKSDDPKNLKH